MALLLPINDGFVEGACLLQLLGQDPARMDYCVRLISKHNATYLHTGKPAGTQLLSMQSELHITTGPTMRNIMKTLMLALTLSLAAPVLACKDPAMHGGFQFGQNIFARGFVADPEPRMGETRDHSKRLPDAILDTTLRRVEALGGKTDERPLAAPDAKGVR